MGAFADRPLTIAEIWLRGVARFPDREALVTRSGRWSYAELDLACDRAAAALWALGVRPGQVLATSLPNDLDAVIAFHGVMRIGAIWVGINRNLATPEKQYLLDDSGASLLLAEPAVADQLSSSGSGVRRVVAAATGDRDTTGKGGARGEWAEALAGAPNVELVPVDPLAPAGYAYTSGTTGYPKAAIHSQHNLLLPGAVIVETRGYGGALRKGDCFPLTILNMHVLTTLLTARAGGCSVIMDRIDAEGVAEWIRREQVSVWNGPPALLHSLADRIDISATDFASLDEVWTGGGDCPEALRERFHAKFGMPVCATYGLSEAPTVVSIDGRVADHREGASGRPLPHLDVQILADDGSHVPPGDTGEVCVGASTDPTWQSAYRPMLGYLGRPEATATALAGGFLHTGDIGFIDVDGFLHIRDRKSLLIIRGGANVYPAEIERVLGEAPGVAACAAFGIPDARLGERVVAAIELQPNAVADTAAITEHCLAHLARYKVPEEFRVVARLPRNAMGKIVRSELSTLVG